LGGGKDSKYTNSLATGLSLMFVNYAGTTNSCHPRLKINLLQYTFISKCHHRGIYHTSILYNIIIKNRHSLFPPAWGLCGMQMSQVPSPMLR